VRRTFPRASIIFWSV